MYKLLRLLQAPFKQHRYLFDQAECVHIDHKVNATKASLNFEVECQYCPKRISVDYYKYHGMIPFWEQYGCTRTRSTLAPKPHPLQFIERELTDQEVSNLNEFNQFVKQEDAKYSNLIDNSEVKK